MIGRMLSAALLAASISVPAMAGEMIKFTSPYPVSETIDRLAAAVEGAGAKVFARIDHAKGAASVDLDLRPTELLLFGNPKLGTPVMQASQSAGMDLPLRAVAYEQEDGTVILAFRDPAYLSDDHGVPADAPVLQKMRGAIGKLGGKATGE
ncbi:MAG: DUF302 domain-containing protein [Pseudomonadota bacterium]